MSAWPVLINALMVAVQVFLLVAFGGPLIIACLVFTSLMCLFTFAMWAQS